MGQVGSFLVLKPKFSLVWLRNQCDNQYTYGVVWVWARWDPSWSSNPKFWLFLADRMLTQSITNQGLRTRVWSGCIFCV